MIYNWSRCWSLKNIFYIIIIIYIYIYIHIVYNFIIYQLLYFIAFSLYVIIVNIIICIHYKHYHIFLSYIEFWFAEFIAELGRRVCLKILENRFQLIAISEHLSKYNKKKFYWKEYIGEFNNIENMKMSSSYQDTKPISLINQKPTDQN